MLTPFKENLLLKKECLAFLDLKIKTYNLPRTKLMSDISIVQPNKKTEIIVVDDKLVCSDPWLKFEGHY